MKNFGHVLNLKFGHMKNGRRFDLDLGLIIFSNIVSSFHPFVSFLPIIGEKSFVTYFNFSKRSERGFLLTSG